MALSATDTRKTGTLFMADDLSDEITEALVSADRRDVAREWWNVAILPDATTILY